MKADKNTILSRLSSACCSPWKSTYVELPEYNTIVLAAYYTGEESSINPVKGYKIYLAMLYKSENTNKDTWCIMTNSGSKVNYDFSISTIDEKSTSWSLPTPFTYKNTQEMDKFFGYSRDITDRIIKSSLDKNDSLDEQEIQQAKLLSTTLSLSQKDLDTAPMFWMYIPQIF